MGLKFKTTIILYCKFFFEYLLTCYLKPKINFFADFNLSIFSPNPLIRSLVIQNGRPVLCKKLIFYVFFSLTLNTKVVFAILIKLNLRSFYMWIKLSCMSKFIITHSLRQLVIFIHSIKQYFSSPVITIVVGNVFKLKKYNEHII